MFPSKSMVDYMSEMNRLFQKPKNDILNASNMSQSPYNSINRSSSSATSTSPESYPDTSIGRDFKLNPLYEAIRLYEPTSYDQAMCETPRLEPRRQQRPIVGRKILPERSQNERVLSPIKTPEDYEYQRMVSQDGLYPLTPPNHNRYDQRTCTPNAYELFPMENISEHTSIRTSPTSSRYSNKSPTFSTPMMSPTMSAMSPTISAMSPRSPTLSTMSPRSPTLSTMSLTMSTMSPPFSPSHQSGQRMFYPRVMMNQPRRPNFGPNSAPTERVCSFCRKNGETSLVYMTHVLKERDGNRIVVKCPILRSHVCSACGATGDDAHTITYCPVMRNNNNGQPLLSTTITLKNTRIKSNGRRRF